MTAVELSDESLLARMLDGDEEAFTLLYRRRHPSIYRFALRMSGNHAVAEDVTQEVFMALIRDGGRFDAARGSFAAFLYGIARNHLHKRWEVDRRLLPSGLGGEEIGSSEAPAAPGNGRLRVTTESEHWAGSLRTGSRESGANRGSGVPAEFLARETVERVRRAVAELPENYREAVVLCDLEEMSYEDAAAALGCPIGTVRSRLHRGRAILLEKLEEPAIARRAPAAAG